MVEEIKQPQEEIKKEEVKTKWDKKIILRIFGVLILIIGIFGVFIYKSMNPEFSVGKVVLLIVGVSILGLGILFGSNILHLLRKKEKLEKDELPSAMSDEVIIQKIKEFIEKSSFDGGLENNLDSIPKRLHSEIGKNEIIRFYIKLFNNHIEDGKTANGVVVHFNANTGKMNHEYDWLLEKPTEYTLKSQANLLSKNPDLKDVEISTIINPLTGMPSTVKKITTKRRKKKMEEKKET